MKRVIWIDDDESVMKETVDKVFQPLWDKKIRSEIYILGDAMEKKSDQNTLIMDLNRVIYEKFVQYLVASGHMDDEEEVKERWELISFDQDSFTADVAVDKNELLKDSQFFINQWKSLSNKWVEDDNTKNMLSGVKKLADQLFLDNDKVVLIDLCLLKGDVDNLMNDRDEAHPMFSMGLYKVLSERTELNAFLYTSFAAPNEIAKKWIEVYKKTFKDESKITIYRRDGSVIKPDEDKSKKLDDEIISILGRNNGDR